jgi:hypothetical protein
VIKAYAVIVFLWGMLVTVVPWLLAREAASGMIISGLGLTIIGLAVTMWRKAGSEAR